MASFTVKVIDKNNEPVPDVRVRLEFTHLTRGMSEGEYTDTEGRAIFNDYETGDANVYVDGKACGSYHFDEETTVEIRKD